MNPSSSTQPMIAFVTCKSLPEITEDDQLIAQELCSRGIEVVSAPWDDPSQQWQKFRAIVIRSPWNYTLHFEAFKSWLEWIDEHDVTIFNPVPVLKDNINKTYLKDLESSGIPIVPTIWLLPSELERAHQEISKKGWKEVVIKPAISADARRTYRIHVGTPQELFETCNQVSQGTMVMIQPFLEDLAQVGEYSLLYYGGKLSHTVLKTPAIGDFRVQGKYGGTVKEVPAPEEAVRIGEQLNQSLVSSLLYARVDLARYQDQFCVVELELTEPSLYFSQSKGAVARFCDALQDKLDKI